MSMKYLGETFDIHTGGEDNIFPHHESEIAQSECATGKPFVNFWMHARFLLVDGKKMAKSAGNFYTLRDLQEKGIDPIALRYELLSTHYRMQQNFTFESLEASASAVERLRTLKSKLGDLIRADRKGDSRNKAVSKAAAGALKSFGAALDEDLNMSGALAPVFDFVRTTNGELERMDSNDAEQAFSALQKIDSVLGVLEREAKVELDPDARAKIEQRNEARKKKDFETADRIRGELRRMGIVLEDTRDGTKWRLVR
jgi:cysteinyl-tRNA synthetase